MVSLLNDNMTSYVAVQVCCVRSQFCLLMAVFQKLRGDQALFQKMVYLLGNLMAVGLGLYKVNSMGLLPTAQSDWLEFMDDREVGTVCQ